MSSKTLKTAANPIQILGLLSILLGFWVGLAALPVLQFGIWVDSEPPIIVAGILLSLAGACALFLIPTSSSSLKDIHPAWLCLWGLPVLGLLFLPFHPYPLLSLLGPANLGQGIMTGFMIAIGTLAMCYFIQHNTSLMMKGAIIAGSTLTLLSYLSTSNSEVYGDLMLHGFRSWLAVVALSILAFGLYYTNVWKRLALIILASITLVISQNKTVIACFLVCGSFGAILCFFRKQRWLEHKGWGILLGALPFLCLIGVILGAGFKDMDSIVSRVHLLKAAGMYLVHHPITFLIGTGWGRFGDMLLSALPQLPVQLYQQGTYHPSSDILSHLDYHPMNQGLETLLSIGILGLTIDILLPVFLWLKLPPQERRWGLFILIPLVAYQSLWFYSPMTLPYLMLIYALFISRSHPINHLKLTSKLGTILAITGLILATGYRAYIAFFCTFENHFLKTAFNQPPITCNSLIRAQGPGQMHLTQYIYFLTQMIQNQHQDKEFIQKSVQETLCACQGVKKPTFGHLIATINFYQYLFNEKPLLFSAAQKNQIEALWKQKIHHGLKLAPLRTDISNGYLIYQLHQKNFSAVKEMIGHLKSLNRSDPIALWFEGILLITTKTNPHAGKNLLREALSKNVQRFLPISQKIIKQLPTSQSDESPIKTQS